MAISLIGEQCGNRLTATEVSYSDAVLNGAHRKGQGFKSGVRAAPSTSEEM